VAEVCNDSEFITQLRCKRIAHRDKDVALGLADTPLPTVEYEKVDAVLAKSAATLNLVEASFCAGATTLYEADFLVRPESLITFLDLGMRAADPLAPPQSSSPDTRASR
jgi:hypothetical protein